MVLAVVWRTIKEQTSIIGNKPTRSMLTTCVMGAPGKADSCSVLERMGLLVICILSLSGLIVEWDSRINELQELPASFKLSPLGFERYSNPTRETERDTALCYSGSPRDALSRPLGKVALSWPHPINAMFKRMPKDLQNGFIRWLNKSNHDRFLPDTHREFLYPSLGKFDLFMAIPTNDTNLAEAVCAAYAPPEATNHVYCAAVADRRITSNDLKITEKEFLELKRNWDGGGVFERNLLLQLYGQHLCNRMIREVEEKEKVIYKYMLRQRPDAIVMAPLPKPSLLPKKPCTVFCRAVDTYCCGNEDIFLYGEIEIMHRFMDRLFDFGKIQLLAGVKRGEIKCPSVNEHSPQLNFTSECLNPYWANQTCGGSVNYVDGVWQHIYRFKKLDRVTALSRFSVTQPTNLKMLNLTNLNL